MTTSADVLQKASNQLGYTEGSNNDNKYGVWYGMNHAPWCAIFISYCWYQAGLPLHITTPKGFAYCGFGIDWFKKKGWWHTTPKVGDLIFFNWHNGGDPFDHVGIVELVNGNGTVTTIEGNWNNKVTRVTRKLNGEVIGFGRPPYDNNSTLPIVPPYPAWPGIYFTLTSPPVTSNHVLKWQQQMIHRGWDLAPDGATGTFGQSTYDVLKKFQKEKELTVDGVLGPDSWNAAWLKPITP